MSDFHAVLQHVLTVAGAKFEAAQELNEFFVQVGYAGIQARLFAHLKDVSFHFRLRFLDDLFNTGRVDPAVLNQLGQGKAGDFAADIVEGADHHDAGGVIDDDVDAGAFFKSADVTAFAADDLAFHVIAGNIHSADGGICGVLGRVAMDSGGQDLPRLF